MSMSGGWLRHFARFEINESVGRHGGSVETLTAALVEGEISGGGIVELQ